MEFKSYIDLIGKNSRHWVGEFKPSHLKRVSGSACG